MVGLRLCNVNEYTNQQRSSTDVFLICKLTRAGSDILCLTAALLNGNICHRIFIAFFSKLSSTLLRQHVKPRLLHSHCINFTMKHK